ncbi:cytochrome P450, partial [Clostridium perfringens]|nr:cytochrome P450 [Clostridium perfringens]
MDIAMGKFGAVWKHQRKVAQLAIKNYASGENLERMVDEALNITLESILKESAKGEAFNIKPHLVLLVMNTLAGVCFGKTYQLEDAEMND